MLSSIIPRQPTITKKTPNVKINRYLGNSKINTCEITINKIPISIISVLLLMLFNIVVLFKMLIEWFIKCNILYLEVKMGF